MRVRTHTHNTKSHTYTNILLHTSKCIWKEVGLYTEVEGQLASEGFRPQKHPLCEAKLRYKNHPPKPWFYWHFCCEIVDTDPDQKRLETALLDSIMSYPQAKEFLHCYFLKMLWIKSICPDLQTHLTSWLGTLVAFGKIRNRQPLDTWEVKGC